jgi:hypothetical protein
MKITNVKHQHVIPKQGMWATKSEGAYKPSKLFNYKEDAVDHASKIAKKHKGCIIVHNNNGKFEDVKCRDEIYSMEVKGIYPIDPIMGNMPI